MGTYLFRWPYPADHVYVTGTFDDWGKTEKLEKVGDHWEKEVKLPSADYKVMYKFVVNDEWIVDDNAPKEDDGHYNINNVLAPSQIKRLGHRVIAISRGRPGSISSDSPTQAATVSAGGEGAPLLTLEQSEANLNRWIPHTPADPRRPVTRRLTQSERASLGGLAAAPIVSAGGMGAPLLSKEDSEMNLARKIPDVTPDPNRPVTRTVSKPDTASTASIGPLTVAPVVSAGGEAAPLLSKEQSNANLSRKVPNITPDPDRPVTRAIAQTDGPAPSTEEVADIDNSVPGAFPETPAVEPDTFKVDPVPATGHQDMQSTATTSKEDYEKLGAIGLAGVAGAGLVGAGVASAATHHKEPEQQVSVQPLPASGHQNTQSSVTTSKEDYENLGGSGTAVATAPAAAEPEVSVAPLPATGHSNVKDSVTTSKEDYENAGAEGTASGEFGDKPLPATGHGDTQSSVTTSKEDYEKLGALGVAGAAVAGVGGAAAAGAFSKPKAGDKNIIPESSLPMNPEKTDTLDAGPFISSSGPGTTTADLASKVPLEPKRQAQVIDTPEAPEASKEASGTPFVSSVGSGATTAGLASQVPLESKKEAAVVEPSGTATGVAPLVSSVGAGATTAALASQVPLEGDLSPEVREEKTALEKELLSKVPESEAKGEPASAAAAQTSYYGLATAVPLQVEESMQKAHASPEAATESSVVAEKSLMERELQSKVPVVDTAGEPAPAFSAATSSTAPVATSDATSAGVLGAGAGVGVGAGAATAGMAATDLSKGTSSYGTVHDATTIAEPSTTASATAADLTDGKTANETVPGTDTSTATTAHPAGALAGGAVVGGAAAAGAAALAARHADQDAEPARVSDAQKPAITTEGVSTTSAASPAASGSMGQASAQPGVAPAAAAALSDGTEDPTIADEPKAPKVTAPVETSDATATEYAPPRAQGIIPGASPMAAAALSDGTEDPTLSEEPAVKMMAQNEAADHAPTTSTTEPAKAVAAPVAATNERKSVDSADIGPMDTTRKEGAAVGGAAAAVGAAGVGATAAAAAGKSKDTSEVEPSKKIVTTPAGIPWTDTPTNAATAPATPKKTTGTASAASTPAKSTTTSTAGTPTGEEKKKKRHRLSAMIKKIFD